VVLTECSAQSGSRGKYINPVDGGFEDCDSTTVRNLEGCEADWVCGSPVVKETIAAENLTFGNRNAMWQFTTPLSSGTMYTISVPPKSFVDFAGFFVKEPIYVEFRVALEVSDYRGELNTTTGGKTSGERNNTYLPLWRWVVAEIRSSTGVQQLDPEVVLEPVQPDALLTIYFPEQMNRLTGPDMTYLWLHTCDNATVAANAIYQTLRGTRSPANAPRVAAAKMTRRTKNLTNAPRVAAAKMTRRTKNPANAPRVAAAKMTRRTKNPANAPRRGAARTTTTSRGAARTIPRTRSRAAAATTTARR
jgi:hypothetical protein